MKSKIIVILGTGTDIGKTAVNAVLTACAIKANKKVVSIKPIQTGTKEFDSDESVIQKLNDCPTRTFYEFPDPLSPNVAARIRGLTSPKITEIKNKIKDLENEFDYLIIESAGGLLAKINDQNENFVDLAKSLSATIVLVTSASLGTLNHTELAVKYLNGCGYKSIDLILGLWPKNPNLAQLTNIDELLKLPGVNLVGALPEGIVDLDRKKFSEMAVNAISDEYYGSWDSNHFTTKQRELIRVF